MQQVAGLIKKSDIAVFYLFNRRFRCRILNLLMNVITQLGSTFFSIFLPLALLLSGKSILRNIGVRMAVLLILTQLIVQGVKRLVNRPRPYRTLDRVIAVKPPACKYSFPSGHTATAFSLGFVLALSIPAFSQLFLLGALLVGISRVYLGFHYPTDVLVGFLISYLSFALANFYVMPIFFA